MPESPSSSPTPDPAPHQRRVRYRGKNPRRFEDKYKELNPGLHAETVAKVIASGKTPAGSHRPIMVAEILAALAPQPGESAADCTLGHGGHTRELLARIAPGGHLFGLDADPIELPKTESRLRALGFGPESFSAHRTNFAGLPRVLAGNGRAGVDLILADLGISSMQIDDPARGFSVKHCGPLDMRMNPASGVPASRLLRDIRPQELALMLRENSDEPRAEEIAAALAGKTFATTLALANAIRGLLPKAKVEESEQTVRRVFQSLRIAVNDEFSSLDAFLRQLPACLNAGGRCAVLTFHSGEDRRVKKAFEAGLKNGTYGAGSTEVIRAGREEQTANPRSTSAKLRWVRKG